MTGMFFAGEVWGAPVINSLTLDGYNANSITLEQPVVTTADPPIISIVAYIGDATLTHTGGGIISGTFYEGPIDVTGGNYKFDSLTENTNYTILVVAQDSDGYSDTQVTQLTSRIPILNSLAVDSYTATSITLTQPTFSVTGLPGPVTVLAYIGEDGLITEAGGVIGGTIIEGGVDVSGGDYVFNTGINPNTNYRIYVVARNANNEYHVVSTTQLTSRVPVLDPLNILDFNRTEIQIAQPSFSVTGLPVPVSVLAYIGPVATITVDVLGNVSGNIGGAVDVSGSGHTFTGLTEDTDYRIIVVARNNNLPANEFDVVQIDQRTSFMYATIAADNGTLTVDGSQYYIPVNSYNITLTVTNNEDDWAAIDPVVINFGPKVFSINPTGVDNANLTYAADPGESVAYAIAGTHNSFTIILTYTLTTISGGSVADIPGAARTITANITGTRYGPRASNTINRNFGIATDGITSIDFIHTDPDNIPARTIRAGGEFFVSGTNYNFDIRVTANGHSWACVSNLTLTIPTLDGGDMIFSINPDGTPGSVTNNGQTVNYSYVAGNWNDFTIRFAYNPTAGSANLSSSSASRTITTETISALFPLINETSTRNITYGIATGIKSVTVNVNTGAGTTPINGQPYFVPSNTYQFSVEVLAYGHEFTHIDDVTLTIPGTPLTFSINPDSDGGTPDVTVTGITGVVIDATVSASLISRLTVFDGDLNCAQHFEVEFIYVPTWSNWTAGKVGVASRGITAEARSVLFATPLSSLPVNHTYGICTSAKILSLSQNLTAADGFINPWDDAFDITGRLVYNVAAATLADVITIDPLLVTEMRLGYRLNAGVYEDTAGVPINAAAISNNFTFNVPVSWFSQNLEADDGIGQYEWQMRGVFSGFDRYIVPETALTLICDKFQVVDVRFQNGGGLDNPPDYYRNIYTAGTQMQVEVRMQYQGAAVNTTQPLDVVASYTYNAFLRTTSLTIPAGGNTSNWVEIQNPSSTDVPPPDTLVFNNYQISSITEQAGGRYSGGTGQNAVGRIIQDATPPRIYWDHADPPGGGAGMFTPWVSTTSAVDTITLNWTPLGPDPEFDTYRIYYKPALSAAWSMIDVNTDPPATNPLGLIGTGTYTITGLQSITEYQYYLTAVDIFGNETLAANRAFGSINPDVVNYFDRVTTGAYGLDVRITDGITAYDNAALVVDNLNPLARPLFDSSIRFEVEIIGASQPGEINVIVANTTAAGFDNDSNDVFDLHPDIDNEVSAVYDLAAAPNGFYRIPISKVSSNKWGGNISSENLLISPGQDCKFILEVIQGGTPAYYGYDPNLNMDTTRFTFSIIDPPKVTPWPTRILNNVITSKNPVAYPAYYLTDDAYVTITAYDIKGRVVATLLDNALRRSGQNIREQGWRGTNKAGRKLGIGLYYIHIKAKRVSDGKTIINKFEKVVMAR